MHYKSVTEGFAVVPPRDDEDREAYADDCDLFLTFVEPPYPLPDDVRHFPPGNHFVLSSGDAPRETVVVNKVYRVRVTVELISDDN